MAADPVLDTYQLAHVLFDIGGRLHPISVRDQMVRAWTVVDRGYREGYLTEDDEDYDDHDEDDDAAPRPLLVVGAGAAGLTAAARAAELGVRVVVVERNATPVDLQASCDSRWLEPAGYDWPLEHWLQDTYPWQGVDVPFEYTRGWANDIGAQWQADLKTLQGRYGTRLLDVSYGDQVTTMDPDVSNDGRLGVTTAGRGAGRYGMVLYAAGHGGERCVVSEAAATAAAAAGTPYYRGYRFWEPDPFDRPNLGLGQGVQGRPPRVLVSGAGDGALQDVLRLCFRGRARDVLEALDVPGDVRERLAAVGSSARRRWLWAPEDDPDREHAALQELHDEYRRAVTLFEAKVGRVQAARGVEALLRPDRPVVQLRHGCEHFGLCYPMNHFLVLLLERYVGAGANGGLPLVVPRTGVTRVEGVGHACAGDPAACHGLEHEVGYYHRPACFTAPPGGGVPPAEAGELRFEVVVLRHGLSSPAEPPPAPPRRHLVPYHVDDA